jgi:hypothetical protein
MYCMLVWGCKLTIDLPSTGAYALDSKVDKIMDQTGIEILI